MTTQITPFDFQSQSIRVQADSNGEPWFVAKDVFDALGISWTGSQALKSIPDDWKGVSKLLTPSGEQDLLTIAEPAVYKIAFRSRKAEAEAFTNRVAEIVTAIRKTGSYTAQNQEPAAPSLIGRRWLVSYDHNGKEQVSQVANDAIVMPLSALLKHMVAPDGMHISTEALFDFVEAATTNLKRRAAYQAHSLQRARQISL